MYMIFFLIRKRAFTYVSQIPRWYLFRFVINKQKEVSQDVDKILIHKWMTRTSLRNSSKLTLQILQVTGRKYSGNILEAKAKN